MKSAFLYTKFIIALLFLASPLSGKAAELSEADKIRDALGGVCLDAWCEGAFDFNFQTVVLKPKTNETQLQFRMSQKYPVRLDFNDGDAFQAQINQRFYDVSCVLPGYSTYDSIMQSEHILRRDFYTALSQCIHALEKRLMQVTQPL